MLGLAAGLLWWWLPRQAPAAGGPNPAASSTPDGTGALYLLVVKGADTTELRHQLVAVLGEATFDQLDLELDRRHITGSAATTQLAVRALAGEQRGELEEALELFADEVADRFSPAPLGLIEGDPAQELSDMVARLLPTLTASRALLVRRWVAPDGTLVVIPRATCPPRATNTADVQCLDVGSHDLPLRVRFTAWPIATAAVLRADGPAATRDTREALRAPRADSTLALVIDASDLREATDVTARSRRAAARAVRLLRRSPDPAHERALPLLEQLTASPAKVAPDWLRLGPTELLVVPRLGQLAALDEFTREIDQVLESAGLTDHAAWVRRPTPL